MDINRVELKGRLVRDPEFSFVGQNNMPKWKANLVVSGLRWDAQKKQEVGAPTFVALEAIGDQAEELADGLALAQGDIIYVLGELNQRTWNAENGEKRERTHVEVTFVQVVRRKVARPAKTNGDAGPDWTEKEEDPGI